MTPITPVTPATSAAPRSSARTPWSGVADDSELDHWEAVAASVAEQLAETVLERDAVGADPTWELELLRDSGLVNLLNPAAVGGGGAHWETAFRVVRRIARVDASLAQVLAYHLVNSANIGFVAPPERQHEWLLATTAGRWVWGDSVNPTDPDLVLTPDGDGFVLDGTKRYSTGASSGDVILVAAVIRGGERNGDGVLFVVDHDRDGIEYVGDVDFLGQRQSASGSVRFTGVRVAERDLLGPLGDDPVASLVTPGIQLFFSNLYLGIAQGALDQGARLTRARRNAWFLSTADLYRNDPFTQRLYGELDASTAAVEALADRVGRRFDDVVGRAATLTAEDRGRLAIDVARVKVVASDLATDLTNRIFEATGSSSARTSIGLDLHWRNARTHSLHDPVDFKKLEVGAWVLNGELQPISLYT